MTKAIAYDRIFVSSLWMILITCEEGTVWMVEEEYINDPKRPIYNPYSGWQMEMVETMGAMSTVL